MAWLKMARSWFRGRKKSLKTAKPLPAMMDRSRWIQLRTMLTGEADMSDFFAGEFDKLRAHKRIESIRIDSDYTVTVRTKRLFAKVFDKTCGKHKHVYIGVFRFGFSIQPGAVVMGLAARPRASLLPIECLDSGRHDGMKTTFYTVGGQDTGGFCFGNQEGNPFLIQQISYGELYTAITFIVSRLGYINEGSDVTALREYRQVLPDGSIARARKPKPPVAEMLFLPPNDWEPIGGEP